MTKKKKKNMRIAALLLLTTTCLVSIQAFTVSSQTRVVGGSTTRLFGGGWGKSQSRDLTDGEKAKGSRRRNFDGYDMQDRGEFMRDVKRHRDTLTQQQLAQALDVARFAGIDVGKNSFSPEFLADDDNDIIDVSVPDDDDDGSSNSGDGFLPMTPFDVSGPL